MLFDLYMFPEITEGTRQVTDSPSIIGTVEGPSINLVAYDLLSAAKAELKEKYECNVEVEYEMPAMFFAPPQAYDYSISAATLDQAKTPTRRFVFGIKKH